MALGTNHLTDSFVGGTVKSNSVFIPELWSDETIAAYKAALVVANRVNTMAFQGKKGDSIHIPKPTRGTASAKAAQTQVTLNRPAESAVIITIDKHFEYSFLIEDFASVQALDSLRKFYTDDSGYALAKQVDSHLMGSGAAFQGGTYTGADNPDTESWNMAVIAGDGSTVYDPTANVNVGNGSVITDVGIRQMIQTLDDTDTPMDNRAVIIPPVTKSNLLGIARFTEQAFVGDAGAANSIRTGRVGNIYGNEVYITTNCPTITATDGVTKYRVGLYMHKDATTLVEQMNIRSQIQYKQEWLSTLYTADTIYGVNSVRTDSGVAFVVPV